MKLHGTNFVNPGRAYVGLWTFDGYFLLRLFLLKLKNRLFVGFVIEFFLRVECSNQNCNTIKSVDNSQQSSVK